MIIKLLVAAYNVGQSYLWVQSSPTAQYQNILESVFILYPICVMWAYGDSATSRGAFY